MHPLRRAALVATIGLLAAAASVRPATAQEARGPEFGTNAYTGDIIEGSSGEQDTDEFVGRLVAGEKLSVRVAIPRLSVLRPSLFLYDPSGAERDIDLINNRRGRVVGVRPFTIDMTGIWRLAITGGGGTEGRYTLSFRTKGRLVRPVRGETISTAEPEIVYEVEGTQDSLLDARFAGSRRSDSFSIASVTGPSGAEMMVDGATAVSLAVARGRSVRLKRIPLTDGDGTYRVTVRLDDGSSQATINGSLKVVPKHPRGRRPKRLNMIEPFIAALAVQSDGMGGTVDIPREGVAGIGSSIQGRGFLPGARVFFDDVEATVTEVAVVNEANSSVSIRVPVVPGKDLVAVTVQNPDGQAHSRPAYFFYVPQPTLTALTDVEGNTVSGGGSLGGLRVRLEGTNFRTGQTVDFGGGTDVIPLILSPELMELTTPIASTTGPVIVRLQNKPLGQEALLALPFTYKLAPTIATVNAYDPPLLRDETITVVTMSGTSFEQDDEVRVDGNVVPSTRLTGTTLTFQAPALLPGDHTVEIVDRFGSTASGPVLEVKGTGIVDSVVLALGPAVGADGIPLEGGTSVDILGSRLHPSDTATLGGVVLTLISPSAGGFSFVAPAGSAMGPVDLVVTDVFARTTTVTDALRYVGYSDVTADSSPGGDATDDLTARRGQIGDLDDDGNADDLLIASYDSSPGTRTEFSRILFGTTGVLADQTDTDFPGSGSDGSGSDNWNAGGVTIGDVDGGSEGNGDDILVAGLAPDYVNYGDVRLFINDGSGGFTLDEAAAPPTRYLEAVYATDELGYTHQVYSELVPVGLPGAVKLGDLDDDGDLDIVVGSTSYDYAVVGVDPNYVDFSGATPYISSANAAAYYLGDYQYYSALLIFENDDVAGGGSFADLTETALPGVGSYLTNQTLPAFHTRDLSLGDIDGDDDLDIVLTWDDPTTVTPYGLNAGTGYDTPRVATRILTNDGDANFTDATATWLGAGSTPEFFQADRCELVDLDNDDDLDLVLLHAFGTDAFQGTPNFRRHALRILRNDSPTKTFTDVTLSAMPLLPSDRNDNWRGVALAVRDVDGDGNVDLLVGTTETLLDKSGNALRRTRLLRGDGNLSFTDASAFLPAVTVDTLESDDLLLGDIGGDADDPYLLLLSETAPAVRTDGEALRVLRWNR